MKRPSAKPSTRRKHVAADLRVHDFELKCSEFRVVCLREVRLEDDTARCETAEDAAEYYRQHIATSEAFNPDVETMFVLLLNTRRRPKGHCLVSTGTLDTLLAHPREIFRPAFVSASAAIILFHNHPSGDPSPSDGDIAVTRDLVRAGQILKIDLLDHVIMGRPRPDRPKGYVSLREGGYLSDEARNHLRRIEKARPEPTNADIEFGRKVYMASFRALVTADKLAKLVGTDTEEIGKIMFNGLRPRRRVKLALAKFIKAHPEGAKESAPLTSLALVAA